MPDSGQTRNVRVLITGHVQGVWFRGWTVETATALELKGWVRNRPDGAVEAVFSGPPDRVSEMLGRCMRGPPAARVADVEVTEEPSPPGDTGFGVRPSG